MTWTLTADRSALPAQVERTQLPPAVEKIRNQIRRIIPETVTLPDQPTEAQAEPVLTWHPSNTDIMPDSIIESG